ncbi:MAG: ribosome-binding factor A, partial [Planctomycetes bacterium]|nr:ribosome-binding factor A [Planctomycetota bacterium]
MKNFRIDKVASVVRQIVSDAIRDRLQDPRVSSMTSVTRVEVSPDLDWARVHVS